MVGGVYQFDPTFLPAAQARCVRHARRALAIRDCAVANTFTRRWEMEPYFEMAAEIGAHIEVIDLYDGGKSDAELAARNLHGVPESVIAAQRARYETLAVISL